MKQLLRSSQVQIKLNAKPKYPITLVGFWKGAKIAGVNSQLGTEFGQLTTVPSQNKVYCCLGLKRHFNAQKLRQILIIWVTSRFQTANYDLASLSKTGLSSTLIANLTLELLLQQHYQLKHHKTKPAPTLKYAINLLSSLSKTELKTLLDRQQIVMQYFNFCRDLQNEAPNLMTPITFAEQFQTAAKSLKQVKVTVWDEQQLAANNMNLILAVGAGGKTPPRLVQLSYQGAAKTTAPIVLLGKGITFDTGGYSLKPPRYQIHMKYDMSGAAIVCSALLAIAKLQLPVNVIAVACLAENLVDQRATLVESVIKSKAGLTVEITNTDAEGRLVLADGITHAFDTLKAAQVIELSTLTGAISVTLGDHITGAFTNRERLFNEFARAATANREPVWRLPVADFNVKFMQSSVIADLVNASSSYQGGASNAAAFLFAFAKKRPFLHLDIAGTATTAAEPKRATAIMLKSLITFFENRTQKVKKSKKS